VNGRSPSAQAEFLLREALAKRGIRPATRTRQANKTKDSG